MPGSVTIGHTDALVMLSHDDAKRLSTVLREMSDLLGQSGPNRLSDAQVSALCEGKAHPRDEFTEWSRRVGEYLKAHL
ncbi:hypothetical protein GCM10010193_30740 [Kitasatospora atroaurantiaca]|uniref:CdiI immunity protein domain-containing protein n=1 Tax=Kitasatospora atroaurantiaca TaxID=285545 RepID=A0A561ER26_9ACTN|nr:hypothetical protein [Kitasatospora atroaurantiaca]TWE18062.1 hypothetical protein FB465_3109 [Kitasatospora atroaurantiaca]